MYTCNGGGVYISFALVVLIIVCCIAKENERNVCPAEMGGSLTAPEWIKWGVGEMGIVEDAIDGVWKVERNARMETHVYSDLWRTTVRRTRWVQSIHRKINNDNHYSDYFIKYDTYINRHASKLLDDGISTSGM
jgi:hypothetical protein